MKWAKSSAKGLVLSPKILSFWEPFSLKSLRNYYIDSIFNFKLTYFVVLQKQKQK